MPTSCHLPGAWTGDLAERRLSEAIGRTQEERAGLAARVHRGIGKASSGPGKAHVQRIFRNIWSTLLRWIPRLMCDQLINRGMPQHTASLKTLGEVTIFQMSSLQLKSNKMYKETEKCGPLKKTKWISRIHPLGNTDIWLNEQKHFLNLHGGILKKGKGKQKGPKEIRGKKWYINKM